jgi:hypothetical protein
MKTHRLAALCLACTCAAASLSVLAQTPVQKPPAGRSGLDPASRTKVTNVLSRTRIDAEDTLATVDRKLVTGPSGSSCATNIGAPKVPEGDSGIGNRFGTANNDQVIVVQGPVINLCK